MLIDYYPLIKMIHVGFVIVSGSFFFLRGIWMLRQPDRLQAPWVRISPHIIDTLLLVSAVFLVFATAQYPFKEAWLTTKLILLPLYIGFGIFAIRRGRTRRVRFINWVLAMLVFVYIVLVALSRDPLPVRVLLG